MESAWRLQWRLKNLNRRPESDNSTDNRSDRRGRCPRKVGKQREPTALNVRCTLMLHGTSVGILVNVPNGGNPRVFNVIGTRHGRHGHGHVALGCSRHA